MFSSRPRFSTLFQVSIAILCSSLTTSGPTRGIVLYVSPAGDDDASGVTREQPFQTLGRARDEVRLMKKNGEAEVPTTIYLLGGTHRLHEALLLDPEDSGTQNHPVIWQASQGDSPVISGSKPISGWQVGDDGVWRTQLAEVASGEWQFATLFVDGEPRPRTRMPENGYFRAVSYPKDSPNIWNTHSNYFEFAEGDIDSGWHNLSDVEIVSLRFWVSSRHHIKHVDPEENVVRFAETTRYRFSDDYTDDGARYYVENVYEALDEPGEWYLDRTSGTLHYIPKPGESPVTALVEAPVADKLVHIEGHPEEGDFVSHIRFEGITFTQNNWQLPEGNPGDGQSAPEVEGAVYLKGASNVVFENCWLVNLSSYAFQIDEGSRQNRFVGNELGNLGGGGFRMGGGDAESHPNLRTGENLIADNHIHHIGRIHHAATGIWIQHSGGNTLTHNEIDHTYYSSIAIGWVWGYRPSVTTHNEISFNHIHHVGQGVLSDMGGIYMLGVAPGTIVRNNLIHDIESHGYGGWGIYTDEGSSHVLIENNIVYRTKCGNFDQHYGRENIVRNNIFAFGGEDIIHRSRVEEHISFFMERNILYAAGDTPFLGGRWEVKGYQHRPGKPWHEPEPDSLNHVFDFNLYYHEDGLVGRELFGGMSQPEWLATGQDGNSLFADPLFADPRSGDFSLDPGSPAYQLGFNPIDVKSVGPRRLHVR